MSEKIKSETLLLRQIHPSFVQNQRVTSQAFQPTPKDKKKLSVYDGDQISPENAFNHYVGKLRLKSIGVMGVSVEECKQISLSAKLDPEPFPEHVVIDFSDCTNREIKKKAKYLRSKATTRGWLYQDE